MIQNKDALEKIESRLLGEHQHLKGCISCRTIAEEMHNLYHALKKDIELQTQLNERALKAEHERDETQKWIKIFESMAVEGMRDVTSVQKTMGKLQDALEFYADPSTYFAVGFWPDPPCGEFMEDFSETDLGRKPGKLARDVLGELERKTLEDPVLQSIADGVWDCHNCGAKNIVEDNMCTTCNGEPIELDEEEEDELA